MKEKYNYLLIALLGGLFFVPFLGASHLFDWDEINFAESAREMILTGNYSTVQINYQPFWEKPPLFFWMQVLAMKAFNVFSDTSGFSPEFGARFPNAMIGIATLLVFYSIGKKLYNSKFGLLWAIAYLGSFTPHLYFKSGIIDPTFNLFIFLGVWFLARIITPINNSPAMGLKGAILSGLFIGLAILTKGPVGGLLWGLTFLSFWGAGGFKIQFLLNSIKPVLVSIGVAFLVACIWFGLSIYENGIALFQDFIAYQIRLLTTGDAGHEQPFYYHFLVVLLGCFPISVFAIRNLGFVKVPKTNVSSSDAEVWADTIFRKWMIVLFWVVMILFTIVKTKIVHYSSMAWFPVSFLAAHTLYQWLAGKFKWNNWLSFGVIFIGGLMAIALALVPIVGMYSDHITPFIKDSFVVGNLQAPVQWSGTEPFIGLIYFAAIFLFFHFRKKEKKSLALYVLFFGTAITLFVYSAIVVTKIEGYTQRTAIDFYESHRGQDIYMEPLGFKSYAHLFYFRKPVPAKLKYRNGEEVLNAPKLDKPAYFVMKVDAGDDLKYHPNLVLIKEENGFLFYRRK